MSTTDENKNLFDRLIVRENLHTALKAVLRNADAHLRRTECETYITELMASWNACDLGLNILEHRA